mgnify:CR=1 FL=1
MDRIFIKVLRKYPLIAPDIFIKMAEKLTMHGYAMQVIQRAKIYGVYG